MLNIPTGNAMAPCVVIGERAAEMIKATHSDRSLLHDPCSSFDVVSNFRHPQAGSAVDRERLE